MSQSFYFYKNYFFRLNRLCLDNVSSCISIEIQASGLFQLF